LLDIGFNKNAIIPMNIKKLALHISAFSYLFSFMGSSFAATQGLLSDANLASSGEKRFIIFVKSRVQITGLDNFEHENWVIGDGDIVNDDDLCIYANSAVGYKVLATSTNYGFNLKTTENQHELPYQLKWSDGTSEELLSYATTSQPFSNASRTSANCNNGTNSTLKLTILESDLEVAPSIEEAYTDIVTITIMPS